MKKKIRAGHLLCFCMVISLILPLMAEASSKKKVHLFIMSGQSNMSRLRQKVSFVPTVTDAFSKDTVIVVKSAQGNQAIRRWYKNWTLGKGKKPRWRKGEKPGDLYDVLMKKVNLALGKTKPDTITFVWMQGERDAEERHGDVYEASLKGLLEQLKSDLGNKDINVVIGRLSDNRLGKRNHSNWIMIRKIQVAFSDSLPNSAWVDTDDLNGPTDDVHLDKEGYKKLGKRFADKAIALIKKSSKN